jgi:hypothetical protein
VFVEKAAVYLQYRRIVQKELTKSGTSVPLAGSEINIEPANISCPVSTRETCEGTFHYRVPKKGFWRLRYLSFRLSSLE